MLFKFIRKIKQAEWRITVASAMFVGEKMFVDFVGYIPLPMNLHPNKQAFISSLISQLHYLLVYH
jgi:hypothetical protein